MAPEPDARYADWTFQRIVERARHLLLADDDPFENLLGKGYGETRIPELAASLVGSAINRARKEQ